MEITLDMTVTVERALAEYNEAADDPKASSDRVSAFARRYTLLRNRAQRGSQLPPEPVRFTEPDPAPPAWRDEVPPPPPTVTKPVTKPKPVTTKLPPMPRTLPSTRLPIPGSAARLKRLLTALGYDAYGGLRVLAKLAGVSLSAFAHARRKGPTPPIAAAIAKALNVPVEYFEKDGIAPDRGDARTFHGEAKDKPPKLATPETPEPVCPAEPAPAPPTPKATAEVLPPLVPARPASSTGDPLRTAITAKLTELSHRRQTHLLAAETLEGHIAMLESLLAA